MAIDTSWKPVTVPDLGGSAFLTFSAALRKNALEALKNITSQSQKYIEMENKNREAELERQFKKEEALEAFERQKELAALNFGYNKELNALNNEANEKLQKLRAASGSASGSASGNGGGNDILNKILSSGGFTKSLFAPEERAKYEEGVKEALTDYLMGSKEEKVKKLGAFVDYLPNYAIRLANNIYSANRSNNFVSARLPWNTVDFSELIPQIDVKDVEEQYKIDNMSSTQRAIYNLKLLLKTLQKDNTSTQAPEVQKKLPYLKEPIKF